MKVVKDDTVNYAEYGYQKGTAITIDSDLYEKLCTLVQYIGQKESTVGFEQKETLEATFSPENKAKPVLSSHALLALSVTLALNKVHEDNVHNGVALHQDKLNEAKIDKPTVTLAD